LLLQCGARVQGGGFRFVHACMVADRWSPVKQLHDSERHFRDAPNWIVETVLRGDDVADPKMKVADLL
jgi:hypothetical protein